MSVPPLRQAHTEIGIATRGRGMVEVTDQLAAWLASEQVVDGLLTLHLKHTSASLLIQENADPTVRTDFERFFARLVRDGDPLFAHAMEGDDDMPAHIRTALTAVNLSIPVRHGSMTLGTWQGIYVWEHRKIPHQRLLVAHYIGT